MLKGKINSENGASGVQLASSCGEKNIIFRRGGERRKKKQVPITSL
jgi:hypothetical protein